MPLDKQKVEIFFGNMQTLNDLYPPEMRFSLDQNLSADRDFYSSGLAKKLIKILEKRGLYIETPGDLSAMILYLSGHPIVAGALDEGYNGLAAVCILLLLEAPQEDATELEEILVKLLDLDIDREGIIKRIDEGVDRYMKRLVKERPDLFDDPDDQEKDSCEE
jgi:hypothetical protein